MEDGNGNDPCESSVLQKDIYQGIGNYTPLLTC